jgi:hypothetical protein
LRSAEFARPQECEARAGEREIDVIQFLSSRIVAP